MFTAKNAYPAVPAGLVETWVASRDDALEIPKSATLAFMESFCDAVCSAIISAQCNENKNYLKHLHETLKQKDDVRREFQCFAT